MENGPCISALTDEKKVHRRGIYEFFEVEDSGEDFEETSDLGLQKKESVDWIVRL